MTDVVSTILEEVEALVLSFEEQREKLLEKLKPAFASIFMPFLAKYPEVTHLSFTAYTPYFNDGDECVYGVNELYGYLSTDDEDDYEGSLSSYGSGNYSHIAEYKRTGVFNDAIKNSFKWYLRDRQRYDSSLRRYVDVPCPYENVEAVIAEKCATELAMTVEELDRAGERDANFKKLSSFFGRIPDDVIRDLFGDHIKVKIDRDGVEVDEYSHD